MKPKWTLARIAFLLLGAMTLVAFGGPVVFGLVLRGGRSPDWPPDRPLEWITLGVVSALVISLMAGSMTVALRNQKAMREARIRQQPLRDNAAR